MQKVERNRKNFGPGKERLTAVSKTFSDLLLGERQLLALLEDKTKLGELLFGGTLALAGDARLLLSRTLIYELS